MDQPAITQEDISLRLVKEDLEKYNKTEIKIKQLQDLLHKWKDDTEKAVEELKNLAEDLDIHFRNISIAKVTGSSIAIVGGILAVIGFGLSFVTFGASLGLSIAGGIIGGLGGTTTGGSIIANAVLSKKKAAIGRSNSAKMQSSNRESKINMCRNFHRFAEIRKYG